MKSFIRINQAGSLIHSLLFTAEDLHATLTDIATAALPSNLGEKTQMRSKRSLIG